MRNKLALILGIALASGTAVAGESKPFHELDKDGNGKLSRSEAAALRGLDFEEADANGDGVLSQREYQAVQREERR